MTSAAHPLRVVAIIPARGGSKGVPGKNLRTIGGVPLVVRAVQACRAAETIDAVFVSTDDSEIAAAAQLAGSEVIVRPDAIAGDAASSETALVHALDQLSELGHQPEVLVFVQCTSPFIAPRDLDTATRLVVDGHADSVFSGVPTFEFLWRSAEPKASADQGVPEGSGPMVGVNHDAYVRPRRQDRQPDFAETGAFYVMQVSGFRSSRHRFFGRTAVVAVPQLSAVEVDTPDDLVLAEAVAQVVGTAAGRTTTTEAADRQLDFIDVDAVITDFDGVHTPDTAYLDETGRESVRVSRRDGLGVARLRAAGVPMLILSTERNPVVTARARKLGVQVRQGVDRKAPAVRSWLAEHGIAADRAAYVGNDVNDLEAMHCVGWPVAVRDARPEVLAAARLTLAAAGGRGAVRELCDLVVEGHLRRAADQPRRRCETAPAFDGRDEGVDETPTQPSRPRQGASAAAGAGQTPTTSRPA